MADIEQTTLEYTMVELSGLDIGDIGDFATSHSIAITALVTTAVVVILAIQSHLAARPWTSKGCSKRLDGKTVIITGATDGIGKEIAHDLAKRGARLIIPCRDESKGQAVADSIHKETMNYNVVVHKCDLASLNSIRNFVNQIRAYESKVDILINCADGASSSYLTSEQSKRLETEDGFEIQTAIKYFGHFLLTNLLLDLFKKSSCARVINLVCLDYNHDRIDLDDLRLNKVNFDPWHAHFRSSLCMVMFTREFGRRFKDSGVTCNMVQPGNVDTRYGRMLRARYPHLPAMYTLEEGARTVLYCALEKGLEHVTGEYFTDCTMRMVAPHVKDPDVGSQLWDTTEDMVGLKEKVLT